MERRSQGARNQTEIGVNTDDGPAQRIAELERQLADLKARLPAHSTPPAMLIKLEELENELDELWATVRKPDNQSRSRLR